MDWKREISGRGVFFLNALRKFDSDHGFFLSSGITFNLLICLVPLSLLLLGLAGTYLYSDREVLNHIRHYLESVAPSLDPKIMRNILRVVHSRKAVGILGLAGLVWASTWAFSSLRTALNIVFQVEKGRGILRGKAIDLLMVFLAGVFHIMSMTLTSVFTFIKKYQIRSPIDIGLIIQLMLKYIIPFLFTFWMFFLIYKIIPDKKVQFKNAFQAALFTSLFWEVAKQLFGWYVLHVGRFSMVYGSLGTLAIFFLWVYYSSAILLLGGEIAFFLERGGNRIDGCGGEEKDKDRLYDWPGQ